jgi:hypothetical protein
MTRIVLPILVLLAFCACNSPKQLKNVSAPVQEPVVVLTDTLPVTVITHDIPDDILVLSTADVKEKTDQAMNAVLLRLKGSYDYQPQTLAGDVARGRGGPFDKETQVKKMSYVTGLSGTGVLFNEDIFIRMEIVSLEFLAHDALSEKEGRLVEVDFPDGVKRLKIGDQAATLEGHPAFAYECKIGLSVLGMLEDGTYAVQRAYITGMVAIPDGFPMELQVK